ncbi:MAG: hypothetical protein KDD82_27025 [Planctomycetes bacterium]|nr:hypothetical protein [Planctomycetota bacterium]
MKSQVDLQDALERLIVGDLRPADAVRLATESGYRTFADMCEAELPEQLPRIRIDRTNVRARIAAAVAGRTSLEELRGWAEELSAVLDRHQLGATRREHNRLLDTLALVAVATDQRIFQHARPVIRVLAALERMLGRSRAGKVARLYGALFHDQPVFHLLARRVEDAPPTEERDAGPPTYLPPQPCFLEGLGLGDLELDSGLDAVWSGEPASPAEAAEPILEGIDVVALNQPYEPGKRVQDYEWVVALHVAPRSLLNEDVPYAPAEGFLERARALAPNFDFERYKPEAFRDHDGVLEIVLDAPTIGHAELVYAAKLFGLVHRTGRVFFEGKRLSTLSVRAQ